MDEALVVEVAEAVCHRPRHVARLSERAAGVHLRRKARTGVGTPKQATPACIRRLLSGGGSSAAPLGEGLARREQARATAHRRRTRHIVGEVVFRLDHHDEVRADARGQRQRSGGLHLWPDEGPQHGQHRLANGVLPPKGDFPVELRKVAHHLQRHVALRHVGRSLLVLRKGHDARGAAVGRMVPANHGVAA